MTVKKTILAQLDKCYATAIMEIGGKLRHLVATEGLGPCIAWSDTDHSAETVWEGPGGTMNIVPIPGVKDEFLATQDFVPTFQAKESKIAHVRYADGALRDYSVRIVRCQRISKGRRSDRFRRRRPRPERPASAVLQGRASGRASLWLSCLSCPAGR